MNRRLRSSFSTFDKSLEKRTALIPGKLGIALGGSKKVEVPGRNSFVYVRLKSNSNEVVQAFNDKVSPVYNLPVLLTREGNRYVVAGRDTQQYMDWGGQSPYLPRHGDQHSFNPEMGAGGDIVWVYSRQFMPMLAIPSGSDGGPNVLISPNLFHLSNGNWRYDVVTGTQSLLEYKPTGSSALAILIYKDINVGNPMILVGSGTSFSSTLTGTSQIYQYIPSFNNPEYEPIAVVRLVSGTSSIKWDNIYDARQFFKFVPTGSAGSATNPQELIGMYILDEGVALGTGTSMNFVGDGVQAHITGTSVWVVITGSTGGTVNPPITGSFVVQDEGTTLGSALILNVVGPNADVSLAGGVARLFITGTAGGSANPPITGSFVVQDEGVILGSALTLNVVGPNGEVTLSGSVARLFITGSAGGGGDETYLRLDATNDPVTGDLGLGAGLAISGSQSYFRFYGYGNYTPDGNSTPYLIVGYINNKHVSQISGYLASGTGNTAWSNLWISQNDGTLGPGDRITGPMIRLTSFIDQGSAKSDIGGALAWYDESGNTPYLYLNPVATGSPTMGAYLFDTKYTMPTGSKIANFRHATNEKFWIGINGEIPLVDTKSLEDLFLYGVSGTQAVRRSGDYLVGYSAREILTASRTYYVRTAPSTVTMTIASPCVVTWTNHGLSDDDAVVFTTSGALPTGIVAGTVYYVNYIDANTFNIAATPDGANIDTSGSQSGTHKASTGTDSGDGLTNAYGHALLTIQQAVDLVSGLDVGIYSVTIQLASSTYNESTVTCKNPVGAGGVTILGDSTTPSNVVCDVYFLKATPGVIYKLQGIKFKKVLNASIYPVVAYNGGSIEIADVDFSSGWLIHMAPLALGYINIVGNYTISAGTVYHIYSIQHGTFNATTNVGIILTGTPAFSGYFAYASDLGLINVNKDNAKFSGTATGIRFRSQLNSVIDTNTGGQGYLPGNASGTTATGGQYA